MSSLFDLLGENVNGDLFVSFTKALDTAAVVQFEEDIGMYWDSLEAGVEMWIDPESGCVTTIYLYSGKKGGHQAYAGELPFGITFSDVRDEVIRKIGEVPHHRGDLFDSWDYSHGRLVVRYGEDGVLTRVAVTKI